MFSPAPLLILLALLVKGSSAEVRNSPITLPITRRLKFSNGTNLVQHGEARIAAFRDNSTHGRRANIPLENDNWGYTTSVGIGNPPTYYILAVDSGSSITWVGANTEYVETDGVKTPWKVAENYASGSFAGTVYTETVTFDNAFTITKMPIGVASNYADISYNGILGIGPTRLSVGTVTNNQMMMLPTITDRLFDLDKIPVPCVGIFFRPSTEDTGDSGILNFGEPNADLYTGNIAYTDVTRIPPASDYWGIDQRITYGTTEILRSTAGIVDCGCTYIYLASDAYENYRVATGATLDERTNLLSITLEQFDVLDDLQFHIGSQTYSLTRNAQIWPRHINYKINGFDHGIYLVVKSLSTPTGQGYDFRLGYVFLQRFYTVFDSLGSRVGFAKTPFTDATTN